MSLNTLEARIKSGRDETGHPLAHGPRTADEMRRPLASVVSEAHGDLLIESHIKTDVSFDDWL